RGGDGGAVAAVEQHPAARDAVDERAGAAVIAIAAQVVGALGVKGDQDDVHPLGTSSIVPFSQERMAASMTSWAAKPSSPEASSGPPACTCATKVLIRVSKVSSKRPNVPIVVFSTTSRST